METQREHLARTYEKKCPGVSRGIKRQPSEDPPDEAAKQRGSIAALRALRVLQLLRAHTDQETYLSSDELIAELNMPNARTTFPIATERKSLYGAVASLRAAGYRIDSKTSCGYALIEHPLSESDAEELALIVESCPFLEKERRRELLQHLSSLAAPNVRERIAGARRAGQRATERVTSTTREFCTLQADELMRCAIEHRKPVSFTFKHGEQQGALKQQTFYPRALVERYGAHFATGYLREEGTEEPHMRTYKLARLRNMRTMLPNGSIALAGFADESPHEADPSKEINSKA